MFWTTLEVKDRGEYVGGISLPTESKRRRYGAAEKDFDGLNRFMAAQWDWNKINAEKRNIKDYF